MPVDILAFADAVVQKLQAAFDGAGVATTVAREYEVQHDLGTVAGLQVSVIPVAYAKEHASRAEDYLDAEVVVVVVERYAAAGKPPRAWLDERTGLVDRCVFEALRRPDQPLLDGEYWPQAVEVVAVFDAGMLREKKVFWSEVDVTFRKLRTG